MVSSVGRFLRLDEKNLAEADFGEGVEIEAEEAGLGSAGEDPCPAREERVVAPAIALEPLPTADGAMLDIAAVEMWLAGLGSAVVACAKHPMNASADFFGFGWRCVF